MSSEPNLTSDTTRAALQLAREALGDDLLSLLHQVLEYYASTHTYKAERIGGVLAGCPRGPVPTPEQLVFEARYALGKFERALGLESCGLGHTDAALVPPQPPEYKPIGPSLQWEADTLTAELDKLGVPNGDMEDLYSLWGRVHVALQAAPQQPAQVALAQQGVPQGLREAAQALVDNAVCGDVQAHTMSHLVRALSAALVSEVSDPPQAETASTPWSWQFWESVVYACADQMSNVAFVLQGKGTLTHDAGWLKERINFGNALSAALTAPVIPESVISEILAIRSIVFGDKFPCWINEDASRRSRDEIYRLCNNALATVFRVPEPTPAATDDWITHGGGECPVEPKTLVLLQMHGGKSFYETHATVASGWNWERKSEPTLGDIIGYKIASPVPRAGEPALSVTPALRAAAKQALGTLYKLARLGNGNVIGNSTGNVIAQDEWLALYAALEVRGLSEAEITKEIFNNYCIDVDAGEWHNAEQNYNAGWRQAV